MTDVDVIINKANQCLNCKNPMCSLKGCPIQTNIPQFISKIKEEDFKSAYCILQENNIMSNICSTVCPTERQCMGSCIKGIKGEPVSINELESFINEWAKENNIEYEIECEVQKNVKIAVIGSGPAGLSCAYELVKKGFIVTVFEKEDKLRWSFKIWNT